ncbi:TrbC/VirB2 family protein [Snodgrassella sp.]|uniref:TrbC/VirB2 family protein n=1 Tax=Snodgrassella sp. TaxID=2815304 RepID=UPI002583A877|nr:TrbC/VirB2 family protein [Snodgrassella sp.]MCO6525489.1 hypothetical protein [Snodgrassella sp.]
MTIKQHKLQITTSQFVVLILFSGLSHLALAAGGFTEPTAIAIEFRTGLYAFIGVLATATLIWAGFEGAMGNMTWTEILKKCLWIVFGGASVVIAAYLWTKGGKITFG